ncbi:MAG TPA: rod shape-determining protein MreC [Verrucomicrobiae bacterium]|jgi:rod shape-determining protein MreC|nr:rod shape-determining protein MreC [Verrucomicrobiae bacterium]
MLKKSHYIILIFVVVLVLVLLQLPGGTIGKLKLAISGLFLPLFGLSNSTHEWLGQAKEGLVPRHELLRQIDQLRLENQQLQLRLQQEAQIWGENARLRGEVGWQRQIRWRPVLARVIARDPANWWRSLEIDRGLKDGLRANLPVLTSDGLVGRVQNVGETRSSVVLLGDPNLRVAALVGGSTNVETGIIAANVSAPQEEGMIDLDLLSGANLVRPGQSVVTWGAGGVFPAGIPIGKIVDIRPKEYGLSTEARVKLAADLSALEEVWVMLP